MFIETNCEGLIGVVDTLTSVSSVLTYIQQSADSDLSHKGREGLALILMSATETVDATIKELEKQRGCAHGNNMRSTGHTPETPRPLKSQ